MRKERCDGGKRAERKTAAGRLKTAVSGRCALGIGEGRGAALRARVTLDPNPCTRPVGRSAPTGGRGGQAPPGYAAYTRPTRAVVGAFGSLLCLVLFFSPLLPLSLSLSFSLFSGNSLLLFVVVSIALTRSVQWGLVDLCCVSLMLRGERVGVLLFLGGGEESRVLIRARRGDFFNDLLIERNAGMV